MKSLLAKIWDLEPVFVTLIGSATFWPILFALLKAFGHPLNEEQETALAAFAVMIAGVIIRKQVVPMSGASLPEGTKVTLPATDILPSSTTVTTPGGPSPFVNKN